MWDPWGCSLTLTSISVLIRVSCELEKDYKLEIVDFGIIFLTSPKLAQLEFRIKYCDEFNKALSKPSVGVGKAK